MANHPLNLKDRGTYVSTKRIVKIMSSLHLCGLERIEYLKTGAKKGYNKGANNVPHNSSCKLEHSIIQNPLNIHSKGG
ncbi:hypothetical protein [uncultured Methanomethylovorans sp.]|uniref:hypothetical protein n=1 Tax=uncultured Methanomethylovorans sp. TaxID=183759 RepID=UPI002AA6FACD|nr:hypothetical protein [uncultured Methanomethylovorans sp.]